jgi:hypothetical protein
MGRKKIGGRIEQCPNNGDVIGAYIPFEVVQFFKQNKRTLDAIKASMASSDIDTLILWIEELDDLAQRARDLLFAGAVEETATFFDNDLPF